VDSPEPCDDHGHGTHTMGTMVGDDGGDNQIGVAPGAEWIGCRNMDRGYGTPASYIECFEFFLAPYPIGGDPLTDGRPDLAPDVVNNSWGCPPSEGCDPDTLRATVEAVRAAGILVVTSAGNSGPICGSVDDPPAIYEAALSVGATYASDAITSFSSRGPVTVDGSNRRKPDISAPGSGIRSSVPGGGYASMSGTSMAAPHVSGVAALLWSFAPHLLGDVAGTEILMERTARPRFTTQGCGGDGPSDVPNHVYGWGVVDALAAVEEAPPSLTVTKQATLTPLVPAQRLVYTLLISNTSAVTLTGVVVTDTLPAGAPLAWAGGVYTYTGGTVVWAPAEIAPGGQLTATLAVTVAHMARGSVVTNAHYGVRTAEMREAVMGRPVETLIPWRVLLFPILREWEDPSW
ncbi:MAG: S8 family serine peptidase, partial [Anaerolineae bacterium]